jgi:hypothetical protein
VVNRLAGTSKQVRVAIGVAIALAVTVAVFLVPMTSGGAENMGFVAIEG